MFLIAIRVINNYIKLKFKGAYPNSICTSLISISLEPELRHYLNLWIDAFAESL